MKTNCKVCVLEDDIWKDTIGNKEKEIAVIREFYNHHLNFECFDKTLKLCGVSSEKACSIVLDILSHYKCSEIIECISENFEPFEIKSKDIPQFSDLDVCFDKVIYALENSGLDGVSYSQMGFFLRTEPRKDGADLKYGENQSKTAEQVGLCKIINHQAYLTKLGMEYSRREKKTKDNLKAKLCLFVPLMQNFYTSNKSWKVIEDSISILSESTQKRRLSNIKTMIMVIEKSLDHEL